MCHLGRISVPSDPRKLDVKPNYVFQEAVMEYIEGFVLAVPTMKLISDMPVKLP
jgi:hypothetical protein